MCDHNGHSIIQRQNSDNLHPNFKDLTEDQKLSRQRKAHMLAQKWLNKLGSRILDKH